jgi:hypothetical protein
MAVSNRLRFEILRRDRFACVYCGAPAKDGAVLEIDHVLPKVLGGKDKPDNLVTACVTCNGGKGAMHPDSPLLAGVEWDAVQWAAVSRLIDCFSEEERRQAYDEEIACAAGRGSDEQHAIGALWFAIKNLQIDRDCIEAMLREVLDALPDLTVLATFERVRAILGPSRAEQDQAVSV